MYVCMHYIIQYILLGKGAVSHLSNSPSLIRSISHSFHLSSISLPSPPTPSPFPYSVNLPFLRLSSIYLPPLSTSLFPPPSLPTAWFA